VLCDVLLKGAEENYVVCFFLPEPVLLSMMMYSISTDTLSLKCTVINENMGDNML
jgi:hypothetical protein